PNQESEQSQQYKRLYYNNLQIYNGNSITTPSSWCVCQFRHFRVRGLIEKNRLFARLASSSAESARFRADVCALSGSTTLDTKRSANRKTSIRHKRTRRYRRLMHDLHSTFVNAADLPNG